MVPIVAIMVSRANTAVSSPMPIFQLKPSGLITGSMVRPTVPARLLAISGGLPPE